ncbi:MAG: carbohydrate binding domain-containing protein [Bacteroidaceae bacterium]|nr:carbohydrate binding domain-containing protein [Bacteroidaceae bacterium]
MKKTFKTFALMLLTAFAFSSCVDVPAPFNVPDKSSTPGGSESPEGTPVTCAQAVELTNALSDGATSAETYTITGYITEVVGEVSRNQQTFWMADTKDGGRIFEAYWANLPEGVTAFTKGMKVKITGKLMKYVNQNNGSVIAEMKNATVVVLDDEGGDTPPAEGTPVTCAQAVELTNALADNGTSTETYTITGYITEVVGNVSRNQQTFWMADTKDGGRVFEAYYANLPEGVTAFTKGMKVKITGQLLKYVNNSGQVTPEIKNATVVVLPDEGGDNPPVEGTEVTCAQAVELTNALADNATSTETYTITGYITEVVGNVSRNQQTFWMADTKDGGKVFEAYWANLPEGVTAFTKGMKVKITGQLLKYVNNSGQVTPEIKNADVVVLDDDGGDTPPIEGTDVTCAQAVELTNALADNGTSTEAYSVTGYITEVVGNVSRNQQTFWMADTKDGGKVFEAYWANLPEGVSAFAKGMKVKITGQLLKYVNNSGQVTPEIKNADVTILEQGDDGGGGDTPGPGGDDVTELVNGGFEEWVSDSEPVGWKSTSSASNATLSKSTEARNGSFACQIAAPGSQNKRLATQEITLEAGKYTFSFYAKSTTANACQTRPGYVPVNEGSVGTYKYGDYVDINNNEWTLVTYDFTLDSTTTLCLVVMNPKNSNYSVSQDILIDDATLVKK